MITVAIVNAVGLKPKPGDSVGYYVICLENAYAIQVRQVTINGSIIPSQSWGKRILANGDNVQIVTH